MRVRQYPLLLFDPRTRFFGKKGPGGVWSGEFIQGRALFSPDIFVFLL